MHPQQYKCPHGVTAGSRAISKHTLHSKRSVAGCGRAPLVLTPIEEGGFPSRAFAIAVADGDENIPDCFLNITPSPSSSSCATSSPARAWSSLTVPTDAERPVRVLLVVVAVVARRRADPSRVFTIARACCVHRGDVALVARAIVSRLCRLSIVSSMFNLSADDTHTRARARRVRPSRTH